MTLVLFLNSQQIVNVNVTDVGALTETVQLLLPITDSGTVAEAARIGLTGADTGTGSDTAAVAATGSPTDTGSEGDNAAVAAGVSATDSAALAEAAAVAASLSVSDSGAVDDTASVHVAVEAADSLGVSEYVQLDLTGLELISASDNAVLDATLADADTGSVSDDASTGPDSTDTGSTADDASVAATLSATDTGAVGDDASVAAALSTTDTGSTGEAAAIAVAVSATDTGALSEAGEVAIPTEGSDSGSSGDDASVAATVSAADTAEIAESAEALALLDATDVASVLDTAALTVSVAVTDLLTLSEAARADIGLPVSDTLALTDAATTSQLLAKIDAAVLHEAAEVLRLIDPSIDPFLYHTIKAYLGDYVWDLTSRIYDCSITSTSNGGDQDAEIQFDDTDPILLVPPPAKLVFEDNGEEYWLGRIDEPRARLRQDSAQVHLIARGYGAAAGDRKCRTELTYPVLTNLTSIFKAVRDLLCPDISGDNTHVAELGRLIREDTPSMLDQSAQQIWNTISALGSSTESPAIWEVLGYGDRDPKLGVRKRPTADDDPDYYIDFRECEVVELSWPLKWVYNRVTVRHANGVAFAEDEQSQSAFPIGIGIVRDYVVNAESKIGSQGDAQAIADAIVKEFGKLRAIGNEVAIRWPAIIRDFATDEGVRPWFVKAGRVIKVLNIPMPGSPLFPDGFLAVQPFFIKETSFGFVERMLTLRTEQRETIAQAVGRLIAEQAQGIQGPTSPGPKDKPHTLPAADGATPKAGPKDSQPGSPSNPYQNKKPPEDELANINIVLKNGTDPIEEGQKAWVDVPFDCVIVEAVVTAAKTGAAPQDTPATADATLWDAPSSGPVDHADVKEVIKDGTKFKKSEKVDPVYQVYAEHVLGVTFNSGDADTIVMTARVRKTPRDPSTVVKIETPPAITDVTVVSIGSADVSVHWETDQYCTGQVKYWRSDDPDNTNLTTWVDAMSQGHAIAISGLDPETEYAFEVTSVNGSGTFTSILGTPFTTAADPTEADPLITDINAVGTSDETAEVSWISSRECDAHLELSDGQIYDKDELQYEHFVEIEGLAGGTFYTFTITSTDAEGNVGTDSGSFTTTP